MSIIIVSNSNYSPKYGTHIQDGTPAAILRNPLLPANHQTAAVHAAFRFSGLAGTLQCIGLSCMVRAARASYGWILW